MLNNYENIDQIFFIDGYKLASSVLDSVTPSRIRKLYQKVYQNVEELLDSFTQLVSREKNKIACEKGCSYCCNQAVFVNFPEVFLLTDFISRFPDADMISKIQVRASEKNKKTSKLSMKEILRYSSACPLLYDNKCLAYKARPMACRIYLSMNLNSCKSYFADITNQTLFPELFDFPLHAGRMLNEGVMSFLEGKAVNTHSMTLEMALDLAFKNKNLPELWCSGSAEVNTRKWSEKDREDLSNFELNS